MLQRRDVLRLGLAGLASATAIASPAALAADDATPAPQPQPVAGPGIVLADPVEFRPSAVVDLARDLSKKPFKAPSADLPDPFKSLSFEQYEDITLKGDARIWGDQNLGFAIEPLHRGFQYPNRIELNLVDAAKAYRLVYATKQFDFGKLNPSEKIGDIGFSGFRILGDASKGALVEIASFQGANFFRAQAFGQVAGLLSRALALKIGDPKGEETPVFRSIWIEKPSRVTNTLTVQALVDSDSITGAFRFTIRPGEATIIDTECTLFPRTNLDNFGIAAMSATHLLGFMDHKKFDDYRPNVGEVCGLQMFAGSEEWVWRPVTNPGGLQISTFVDSKPRGFGYLLRDRDFEDYADENNHWERRPSLWIEPLGDWGEGGIQLIEIPSQSDANDNILAFWRPKEPLKAGSEIAYAYRQFWCWDPPTMPDVARAVRSRSGGAGKRQRYFVEFRGESLADAKLAGKISPALSAGGGTITMTETYPKPDQKAFQVLFELDPGNAESSELRLVLRADDKPVSETWLYRWTPA